MSLHNLTSEEVKDFFTYMHMHQSVNAVGYNKIDRDEMEIVAEFLDAINIIDKELFMESYTNTIGSAIYYSFVIGDFSKVSSQSQIKVCVHECQHVIDYNKEKLLFLIRYISNEYARALSESRAMVTELEMDYMLRGSLMNYKDIDQWVFSRLGTNYGIRSKAIDATIPYIKSSYKIIEHGGVVSDAGRISAEYWRQKQYVV